MTRERRESIVFRSLLGVALVGLLSAPALARDSEIDAPPRAGSGASGPLPLEVVVSLREANPRSPIHVSPDGEWIAHTIATAETIPRTSSLSFAATGFPFGEGDARMEATVSRADGGESIRLGSSDAASWGAVWSPDGRRVAFYSDEGGEAGLWIWDPESGAAREIARVEGWELRSVVTPWFGSGVAWAGAPGDARLWVFAREEDGWRGGIVSVDPATGETDVALARDRTFSSVFNRAASPAGGRVYVLARSQQQPGEIESFDVASGAVTRVSRINGDLGRHALGEARLLRWTSANGDALAGTLLLPPGDPEGEPGRRLPLVVFVYGGEDGSRYIARFGLWGELPTFNMHVLSTRGYAVLMPDAPIRPGHITEDLVAAVMPAVDAAIDQGYADPERLAVMGQSFGALNVLALLTRTDRFGAAVITAAVQHPDLVADFLSDEGSGYYETGQGGMEGSPWEVPERYRENSPIYDFPEIETPLLIGQGDQDGDLVPSKAIFTALERLGKSVELRIYRGERHVVTRPANVVDFWRRRLEFLARNLELEVGPDGRVRPAARTPLPTSASHGPRSTT